MAEFINNPATEVANENKNVVAESTSINNQNSNDMVEEKSIATEVAPVAEEATNETINAAENAASINSNSEKMENKNDEVAQTTRIAIIDGKEKTIVVANTKYAMELPKDKKELCKKLDPSKLLSVIYHFTKPELFWREGYDLYDENGNIIKEGTPDVFVHIQTSDDYWRVGLEDRLEKVEIVEFSTYRLNQSLQSRDDRHRKSGCSSIGNW